MQILNKFRKLCFLKIFRHTALYYTCGRASFKLDPPRKVGREAYTVWGWIVNVKIRVPSVIMKSQNSWRRYLRTPKTLLLGCQNRLQSTLDCCKTCWLTKKLVWRPISGVLHRFNVEKTVDFPKISENWPRPGRVSDSETTSWPDYVHLGA